MGRSPRRTAKKLIGAARHWAGAGDDAFAPDQNVVDALVACGAPPEIIERVRNGARAADYEVWPENEDAVDAFLELGNCWDWVAPGMGRPVRVGIPASEIESTLRLLGFKRSRRTRLFRDVRMMERAALEVMNAA